MHELAVTQSMLDLVLEEAKRAGAQRVDRINLVIGDMSGIVGDSVSFYFEFLSRDTIAQGACLSITSTPTQARCRRCGHLFAPRDFNWSCPACENPKVEIVAGNELFVESIEAE